MDVSCLIKKIKDIIRTTINVYWYEAVWFLVIMLNRGVLVPLYMCHTVTTSIKLRVYKSFNRKVIYDYM